MNTTTIKNIPQTMHQALKERAKAHGRSLNKEVIATLEGALHATPIDAEAISRHARVVRETMGIYMTGVPLNIASMEPNHRSRGMNI